jgi:hypothetical protein
MTDINAGTLEHIIKLLNSLEVNNGKDNKVLFDNENQANEVKGYLTNYDVEIKYSAIPRGYYLTVSKKEKR